MFHSKVLWTILIVMVLLLIAWLPTRHKDTNLIRPSLKNTQQFDQKVPCNEGLDPQERLSSYQMELITHLIATHPEKEIRVDLLEKIRREEVCFGKRIYGTDNAVFTVVRKNVDVPFIFIREELLSPRKKIFARIVIYHEYVHYTQWLAGDIDSEPYSFKNFAHQSLIRQQSVCKKIWYAEFEAYQKECELVARMNLTEKNDLCKAIQRSNPELAITTHLIEGHAWGPACSPMWSEFSLGRF